MIDPVFFASASRRPDSSLGEPPEKAVGGI
jgi:hypothetical protein